MIDLKSSVVRGKLARAPRTYLYGVEGIGKTTFAAGCPKPVIVCVEKGADNVDVPKLLVNSWEETMGVLNALASQPHEFKTVAIDTVDALEKYIFQEIVRTHRPKIRSIEDLGWGKGYTKALDYWTELLAVLDQIHAKNIMPLLIGHAGVKGYNPPDGDSFDRFRPLINEKAAHELCAWCDLVAFVKYDVATMRELGERRAKGISSERRLYTEERPAHWAKNRYDLPYELDFTRDVAKSLIKQICGINGKKQEVENASN